MLLRAARARRIATATAFSGGGLTLLGAGTVALLYLQAKLAHRAVGFTPWTAPEVDGHYGDTDGSPFSLLVMGDSTAAGFAVDDGRQTPGSLLAQGISAVADRPVSLRNVAVVGAASRDLPAQMAQVRATGVDLAVILIGANDVIHRMRPADSVRHLQNVVRELREAGAAVVVGTCPDLSTVEHLGWPLRYVARRASRQLAAAQTIAVVEEGGRTVSLTNLLAEEFQTNRDEMFGPDRFHPSARGYAQVASAVLPSACASLGLLPELEVAVETDPVRGVLPVARAAVEAAEQPGTEVSGARKAGRERGRRGRWATLIRRRGRPRGAAPGTADADQPVEAHHEGTAPEASGSASTG